MSLINIVNLTFGYEDSFVNVFEDVCLQLDTNWKLGMIARNGKGKTTFCKLLMNELPYQGKINAKVKFEYFPYKVREPNRNTQDIIEEYLGDIPSWKIERELNKLQLKTAVLAQCFETLSQGEKTKILLLILFLKENNFLLIDEPTNHLDMDARKLIGTYLNGKRGFIVISHDRAFLDSCIDHVLSINNSSIEIQKGNYSSWQINKERNDEYEKDKYQKIKKEVKRLQQTAKQKANWSDQVEATKIGNGPCDRGYIGHKAAKMMKRSKAIEKRIEAQIKEKKSLLKNVDLEEDLKLWLLPYHKTELISLQHVDIIYQNKLIVHDLSFVLHEHERLAIKGINGSGKTTLIKLLLNDPLLSAKGMIQIGSKLKISYVSQDVDHLSGSLKQFIQKNALSESLFKAILRKLDFSALSFEQDLATLSEGQKKKVLLAASLALPAHLYLWDEPLNYLDVISRLQIEKLIMSFNPTMIFVEHDQAFCDKIATKYIEL